MVRQVHRDARPPHYRAISGREIHERAAAVARDLGHWLARRNDEETAACHQDLGRRRLREGVPLPELIYMITSIRKQIVRSAAEASPAQNSLDLNRELELCRGLNSCFELILYHTAAGYDEALREQVARAAEPPYRRSATAPRLTLGVEDEPLHPRPVRRRQDPVQLMRGHGIASSAKEMFEPGAARSDEA